MKKIAIASVLALAVAMPAFANEETKAAAPAGATVAAPAATDKVADKKETTKEASPAAGTAMKAEAKPVELKDGSWAKLDEKGGVWVSKDAGKTWAAAPDGTWEAKDGSKITTKMGKKI